MTNKKTKSGKRKAKKGGPDAASAPAGRIEQERTAAAGVSARDLDLHHNKDRPCCAACVRLKDQHWRWLDLRPEELRRWVSAMEASNQNIYISVHKADQELSRIACATCQAHTRSLIARHLDNRQVYPLCSGVAVSQRGEAYCIPWTLTAQSLQELDGMIKTAGTEKRTVTFQQTARNLVRNGRAGGNSRNALLPQELLYHTHLNEAARLSSQCAKLCRDVQQKLEFVRSTASTLPEAWREMRAATQAAEDQLELWMTHLGQVLRCMAKYSCSAFLDSAASSSASALEERAFNLVLTFTAAHENTMTELAQLAAQQRCGFAKLMADVSHILSRETDQLDATFFVRKYEVAATLQGYVEAELMTGGGRETLEQLYQTWRDSAMCVESGAWEDLSRIEVASMNHRLKAIQRDARAPARTAFAAGHDVEDQLQTFTGSWQKALDAERAAVLNSLREEFAPHVYGQTGAMKAELEEWAGGFSWEWKRLCEEHELKVRFSQDALSKSQEHKRQVCQALERLREQMKDEKTVELAQKAAEQSLNHNMIEASAAELQQLLDYRFYHTRSLFLRQWQLRKLHAKLRFFRETKDGIQVAVCGCVEDSAARFHGLFARLISEQLEEELSMWQASEVEKLVLLEQQQRKPAKADKAAKAPPAPAAQTRSAEPSPTPSDFELQNREARAAEKQPEEALRPLDDAVDVRAPFMVAAAASAAVVVDEDSDGWEVAGQPKKKPAAKAAKAVAVKTGRAVQKAPAKPKTSEKTEKPVAAPAPTPVLESVAPQATATPPPQQSEPVVSVQTVTGEPEPTSDGGAAHETAAVEAPQVPTESLDTAPVAAPGPECSEAASTTQESEPQPASKPASKPAELKLGAVIGLLDQDTADTDFVFGDFVFGGSKANPQQADTTSTSSERGDCMSPLSEHQADQQAEQDAEPRDQQEQQQDVVPQQQTGAPPVEAVIEPPVDQGSVAPVREGRRHHNRPAPPASALGPRYDGHYMPDGYEAYAFPEGYYPPNVPAYPAHPMYPPYPYAVPPNGFHPAYMGYPYSDAYPPQAFYGYEYDNYGNWPYEYPPAYRGRPHRSGGNRTDAPHRQRGRWNDRYGAREHPRRYEGREDRAAARGPRGQQPRAEQPRGDQQQPQQPHEPQQHVVAPTVPTQPQAVVVEEGQPQHQLHVDEHESQEQHQQQQQQQQPADLEAPMQPSAPVGLRNDDGENSCFVNVVIQSLAYLDPFKRRLFDSAPCRNGAESDDIVLYNAVLEAIRAIDSSSHQPGTQQQQPISMEAVREALSGLYGQSWRFHNGQMNDAIEAFEGILASLSTTVPAAVQQVFELRLLEQLDGAHAQQFTTPVLYVPVRRLQDAAAQSKQSFARLIQQAHAPDNWSQAPRTTSRRSQQNRPNLYLQSPLPAVLCLGLVLNSLRSTKDVLRRLNALLPSTFRLDELVHPNDDQGHGYTAKLRAVICFQPSRHHYVAFVQTSSRADAEQWFCFNDIEVLPAGGSAKEALEMSAELEAIPCLLLYNVSSTDAAISHVRPVPQADFAMTREDFPELSS